MQTMMVDFITYNNNMSHPVASLKLVNRQCNLDLSPSCVTIKKSSYFQKSCNLFVNKNLTSKY